MQPTRSRRSWRLKAQISRYLADARARVDTVLAAWAARGDEVIRYSLLGEGKRLRPTLVFASHEALNAGPIIRSMGAQDGHEGQGHPHEHFTPADSASLATRDGIRATWIALAGDRKSTRLNSSHRL